MKPSTSSSTWIGLDAGTTGVTAVLFDQELRPLARASREFQQFFPRPGWVEHDARGILAAVDATLEEVIASPHAVSLAGIGITNQRETVFALDRTSGEPLARGIVWQDRRTSERCRELQPQAAMILGATGLPLDPYFSGTKIEWLLASVPGLQRRAEAGEVVFVTVDALIVHHLTAGAVLATEPTNASRTMLFDIEQRQWAPELCGLFGVRPEWLPDVRPSVGDFGAWRSVPIRGIAGDQQAALFGHGGWAAGSAKCTFGTGTFLLINHGPARPKAPSGLLTTLAVGPAGEPVFAIEGSVFMGGAVVQWLRDQMGFIAEASDSEALARSVADTGGVYLVPAFTGLGAPHWDPDARAAILGMTRGTGRAEIVRAGLEAIAFQNAELIELLRSEAGIELESLLVDGGAAANDLLMQLQADLAGVSIVRPPAVEATARGAAGLAALGAGAWGPSAPPSGLAESGVRFEVELDGGARAERLLGWRAAVERVRS
jgi:glycerol kinase